MNNKHKHNALCLMWIYINIIKREMEENKTQMDFLEMKNTTSEMKNTLDGIYNWLDTAEENISELGDLAIKMIKRKKEKEKKRLKKLREHQWPMGQYQAVWCICHWSARKVIGGRIFQGTMAQNFPSLLKATRHIDPKSSEPQQKTTPKYIILKFLRSSDKENVLKAAPKVLI